MKNNLCLYLFFFCSYLLAQKTIGSVERLNPTINHLIPENSKVEILAEGFNWSEGPLWIPELKALFFTDVPENKLYRWDETNGLELFLSPSGYTGYAPNDKKSGGNGLTLDLNGNLLIAQHGDRRIAMLKKPLKRGKEFITVVDNYQGKRFHSPNDLVFNKKGDLYFTDPPYGLSGDTDPLRELTENGVYRLQKNGILSLEHASLSRPNGLAFSPDQSILYIANSDPDRNLWMAFDVDKGQLKNGRVFFDATDMSRPGLADGLKVHSSGHLFATGPGGVLIFSSAGEHLGTILTQERTANCAFNADESYLYMTSDRYLTRIKLK
jgi:gluconolactonase